MSHDENESSENSVWENPEEVNVDYANPPVPKELQFLQNIMDGINAAKPNPKEQRISIRCIKKTDLHNGKIFEKRSDVKEFMGNVIVTNNFDVVASDEDYLYIKETDIIEKQKPNKEMTK